MKQLAANLKTLYQCKKLWFPHLLLTMLYFCLGISEGLANFDFSATAAFAFLNLFYGITIGILINDLFRKPFLYCLPGQKKSAQSMTLLIWLFMILLFTLISGLFNVHIKIEYKFYLISIGLLSLNYWFGVASLSYRGALGIFFIIFSSLIGFPILYAMKSSDPAPILVAAPGIIFLICIIFSILLSRFVMRFKNIRRRMITIGLMKGISFIILSTLIIFPVLYAVKSIDPGAMPVSPDTFFLICIILSYLQFRSIGRIEKRHLCTFTIIIREGIKFSRKQKTHRLIKGFSNFFSGRITASKHSSFSSQIWSQAYLIFGPKIVDPFGIFIGYLFIGFFLFILFALSKPNAIYANASIIIIFNQYINYQRFNSFLLTSRGAYFFRGIVNLFTSILFSLIKITLFFIIFFIISGSLPYNKWIPLISPLIVVPVLGALNILLSKNNWGRHIFGFAAAIAMYFGFLFLLNSNLKDTSIFFNTTVILPAIAIAWSFHLFVLHYDSMKRTLC